MFLPHKILNTTSDVSHILTKTENQNILCPFYIKKMPQCDLVTYAKICE